MMNKEEKQILKEQWEALNCTGCGHLKDYIYYCDFSHPEYVDFSYLSSGEICTVTFRVLYDRTRDLYNLKTLITKGEQMYKEDYYGLYFDNLNADELLRDALFSIYMHERNDKNDKLEGVD